MNLSVDRTNTIIKDMNIKRKFEEFSNGFFEDISMKLYEKDGKYFLDLTPCTDRILKSNMCVTANSKEELETIIEELSCNIGIMLTEKAGKIQKKETDEQTISINGKEVSLLNYKQICIEGGNRKTDLYKDENLTEKIKSISSRLFGSERNSDLTSYVKNTMFTRMNGRYTLEKEDFELLKYYKEEGYEFLNSFLNNGELKTRGHQDIGKEFIDKLCKIDSLFEKFPSLDNNITVYRGTTIDDSSDKGENNSFLSTSLSREVAQNFSKGRLYEINLPKGTHYIPLDAINGFESMYTESEAEILLRPSSLNITNKEMVGSTEVLTANAKEKKDFLQIIRQSLERRKNELIGKGFCDENEFRDVLDYLSEKHKEKMISEAKENENKYRNYKADLLRKISETRGKIDAIQDAIPKDEIEKAGNRLKEAELIQEYNSLINSAKGYDLTIKEIQLLLQTLEGKIDLFERSKGLKELNKNKEQLENQKQVIYLRDEVSKLKSAIKLYELQGNKEKVEEFSIKLESAQRELAYLKSEQKDVSTDTMKQQHKNNSKNIEEKMPGYSMTQEGYVFTEKWEQVLLNSSGQQIGSSVSVDIEDLENNTRRVETIGTLENEDGIYSMKELSTGIGTELEHQRKDMSVINKITGQKEQYAYQKDNKGNELYYHTVDGKTAFRIIKNSRGTSIENYDSSGNLTEVFEYDADGKAINGMGDIQEIDENYLENFFDSQVPYFEAENRDLETDNKQQSVLDSAEEAISKTTRTGEVNKQAQTMKKRQQERINHDIEKDNSNKSLDD